MKRLAVILACTVALMGCEAAPQTTSGREYLAKYQDMGTDTQNGKDKFAGNNIDKMIRQAAAVEPVLKFPARIGLARIDNGRLSNVPLEEVDAWKKTQEKLGSEFGQFVPLNPLVVEMTSNMISDSRGYYDRGVDGVINQIRIGAARQHLDAVLVYEEHSKEETSDNLLSLGKITIIGGFLLPSESHEAQGFADGMLIDVIQGYPYGNIQTIVEKQTKLSSAWGWGSKAYDNSLSDSVKIQAGKQLAEEAVGMFTKLRTELVEKRVR